MNWANLKNSGLDGWTHFAALTKSGNSNKDMYENGANCGRCVRVRCSCEQSQFQGACQGGFKEGKETILMVVDSCPTCHAAGDIDTSTAAWNSITGNEGFSRYEGTWEFVECPSNFVTGNAGVRVKPGSSKWWHALQPVNFRHKITKMELNGEEVPFGVIDGFWWVKESETSFPATLVITNSAGDSASITLNESDIVGDKEFSLGAEL